MRHKYPSEKPLMDFFCHIFKRRSLTDHHRVDARKPRDKGGNFPARVDERMEFIRDLVSIVMIDCDFRNAGMVRVPSCGLYVNDRIHGSELAGFYYLQNFGCNTNNK